MNTLKLSAGMITGANTIDNTGDLYVQGANLTTSSTYIISNSNEGNITITSGNLYTYNTIINSDSTGAINISGGSLYSNSSGNSSKIINASNSETINITGGSIGLNYKTSIYISGDAELYIHENVTINSQIIMHENSYLETNGVNIK